LIHIRRAEERGHADHGWLNAYHTFSFSDYYDPEYMGFSVLRVINEDRVQGGAGFPTHGHSDMEIITYVIEGLLEHKDTLGNSAVIRPGEVQYMSAGTGIRHSEFNPSKDNLTHLLQIWILPDKKGYAPQYGQKSFEQSLAQKNFVLVTSSDGREGSISIHQDMSLYVGKFKKAERLVYKIASKRSVWIQIVKGSIQVNGQDAAVSDGVAIALENEVAIEAVGESEFLFFDLPS
jgi:quercetin 2,3-dioxygenase